MTYCECGRPAHARGYCMTCYFRYWEAGAFKKVHKVVRSQPQKPTVLKTPETGDKCIFCRVRLARGIGIICDECLVAMQWGGRNA